MEVGDEYVLVSAPNRTGECFVKILQNSNIPFVGITNNRNEQSRLKQLGVENILFVDTGGLRTSIVPELPVGKVFLFEFSLPLCCRYVQICRSWTGKPIYVITESNNERYIYRELGANYIIHTNSDDLSFLVK